MKAEIKVVRAPSYTVAYMIRVGPYTGQNMWRSELSQLDRWAKKRRLRTGKWIMYFIDRWGEKPAKQRRSVAAVQLKSNARAEGKVKIMRIPSQKVASVTFNHDKVSEELVYYGLESWLDAGSYKQAGTSRELYDGSPWANPRAWANCEVQVPLKRK
jgi:effector-binding domain-containing protein